MTPNAVDFSFLLLSLFFLSYRADVLHMLLCAGVYPIPEEGALDAWAPISAPISANEPVGAGRHPLQLSVHALRPIPVVPDALYMKCALPLCMSRSAS